MDYSTEYFLFLIDTDMKGRLIGCYYKFCIYVFVDGEPVEVEGTCVEQALRVPEHSFTGIASDVPVKIVETPKEIFDAIVNYVEKKNCRHLSTNNAHVGQIVLERYCMLHNKTINIDTIADEKNELKWSATHKPNY